MHHFNQMATRLGADVVILAISCDLPFALHRYCAAEGIDNVITLWGAKGFKKAVSLFVAKRLFIYRLFIFFSVVLSCVVPACDHVPVHLQQLFLRAKLLLFHCYTDYHHPDLAHPTLRQRRKTTETN